MAPRSSKKSCTNDVPNSIAEYGGEGVKLTRLPRSPTFMGPGVPNEDMTVRSGILAPRLPPVSSPNSSRRPRTTGRTARRGLDADRPRDERRRDRNQGAQIMKKKHAAFMDEFTSPDVSHRHDAFPLLNIIVE